jgi:hypothetical protein
LNQFYLKDYKKCNYLGTGELLKESTELLFAKENFFYRNCVQRCGALNVSLSPVQTRFIPLPLIRKRMNET